MSCKFPFLLILCFVFLGAFVASAQDIHFTNFEFSPITLNPAKAGDFNGSFRVSGIYRDQWRFAGGQGVFTTPAITYDMPLFAGLGERDWVAIGGTVYSDGTGTPNLRTTSFIGAVSYHISLDKKRKNVLSIGVSSGMLQKRLNNINGLRFEDEILEGVASRDINNVQEMGRGQADFNAGLLFKSRFSDRSDMELGFSLGHISRPVIGVLSSGGSRVPIIFRLYGIANIPMGDHFSVTPRAIVHYIQTTNNQNFVGQMLGNFHLDDKNNNKLSLGVGYRWADALQILGGLELKNIRVGLAYDLRTAVFSDTGGTFELGATYIAKIYKRPKVNPTVLCPRL
jgi:type IX secretion system PorP/SprF family membrane protein